MAIDKKLQIFDDEGNPVDYDILASDVKFLPDGKDLPTKLAEMEQEIEDAGQGDGTVTGVKVGSNTYEPTEGVVDLSTPFSGKVDKVDGKGLSKNDYTDADKAKVDNLKTVATSGSYNDLTDKPAIPEGATPDQSLDPNSDNAVSNAAVCDGLSTKANDNAVVKSISVNGTSQTKDGNGNVNVVVPTVVLDDAPTTGSNNPVKSGGIKTALDAKANAADVPTKTEMATAIDDAVTDAQVTVVPAGSVGIIDGLGSNSTTDALSANMGNVIKRALIQLWISLGNYAFPNGRPVLDFSGGTQEQNAEVSTVFGTNVTPYAGDDEVSLGDSLTIQLSTTDDLYVINPSSVRVMMANVDVTANYYNPNTDVVQIPSVMGDVEITANAMTYIGYGEVDSTLVLMLDYRHMGGTGSPVSGHWKSLVNYGQSPIDFELKSGVSVVSTGNGQGVVFDGSANAYAVTDAQLNVLATAGTVEAVASGLSGSFNTILVNPIEDAIGLSIHNVSNDSSHKNAVIMMGRDDSAYTELEGDTLWAGRVGDSTTDFAIAVTAGIPAGVGHNKAENLTLNRAFHLVVDPTYHNKLAIGCRLRASNPNYLNGTIKAIRVYSSHLTANQQLQNWIVDKKRFNL